MRRKTRRVLTYALCDSGAVIREAGVTEGHHGLSHHGENEDKKKKLTKDDQFHVRQLAYFLDKLKKGGAAGKGKGGASDGGSSMWGSSTDGGSSFSGSVSGGTHSHHSGSVPSGS